MRNLILPLTLCAPLFAQSSQPVSSQKSLTRYGTAESAAHEFERLPNGARSVTTTRSVNGRTIPMESTDEKVISRDGSTTVVERVIKRYDANGNPGPSDVERVQVTKNADGSTTTATQLFRSDLNGNRQLAERSTSTVRTSGDRTETSATVERASVNGDLRVAEKYAAIERKTATGSETSASTYRVDSNGSLREAERDLTVVTVSGPTQKADSTKYTLNSDNRLDVSERRIATTVKRADGSESESVDVYARSNALRMTDADAAAGPKLQQQISTERKRNGDGSTSETTVVKGRLPNDPSRFGVIENVSNVSRESRDAKGNVVITTDTTLGRRDINGQMLPQEQNRSVTVQDPPPPPKEEAKAEEKK